MSDEKKEETPQKEEEQKEEEQKEEEKEEEKEASPKREKRERQPRREDLVDVRLPPKTEKKTDIGTVVARSGEVVKRILADPAKPEEVEIQGVGDAAGLALETVDLLREHGFVQISKLSTGLTRRQATVSIKVKKAETFEANMAKQRAERDAAVQERIAAAKNTAFVFIKPHAATEAVKKLVEEFLTEKGFKVMRKGVVKAEAIDKRQLIDKHYYPIASKATLLPPKDIPVPEDKFEGKFGVKWSEVLEKGEAYNAKQACEKLKWTGDELEAEWKKVQAAGNWVKLGGGFYCGKFEVEGDTMYVFNAFFMSMRKAYVAAGAEVNYFVVDWSPADYSWAKFRGELLGATDPTEGPETSLRGQILAKWEELGLKSEPNKGDNGVHASASPFEAMVEQQNWLGRGRAVTALPKLLQSVGVKSKILADWAKDPQVNLEDGKKGSLFDQLEDQDTATVVNKVAALAKLNEDPPAAKEEAKEE